jgi:hypothetical protein
LHTSPNMIECVADIAGRYAAFYRTASACRPSRRGRSSAHYFEK